MILIFIYNGCDYRQSTQRQVVKYSTCRTLWLVVINVLDCI